MNAQQVDHQGAGRNQSGHSSHTNPHYYAPHNHIGSPQHHIGSPQRHLPPRSPPNNHLLANSDSSTAQRDNLSPHNHPGLNASNGNQPHLNSSQASRMIDLPEHEIVVSRLFLQVDRIKGRLKKLSTKSTEYNEQIQKYINIGDKEQAYFALSKKKQIEDFIRKHKKEVAFLEKQIDRIEEVGHDVKMTEVIRDSNKVLERMIKEIDIEEVHQAKILQEEGKMRREELDELLQSCIGEDSAADAEIAKQIDDIEKSMLLHTEFKKPSQAINTKNIELGIPQHKPKQQPPKQQSQVYESVYRPFDNKEDPVPEVKKPAQKHALPSEFLLQNM